MKTSKPRMQAIGSKQTSLAKLCSQWRAQEGMPQKVAVMRLVVLQAWDLVHRLEAAGVKFAGTRVQATLTVAGTAYAAWRLSIEPAPHREPGDAAMLSGGLAHGLEFAMKNVAGIPSLYADDFAELTEKSTCPIDRFPPLEIMAKLWPHAFTAAGPKLKTPAPREVDGHGFEAQVWDARPNILTAPARDVIEAARRAEARWKRSFRRTAK